jgi:hypothetical protein
VCICVLSWLYSVDLLQFINILHESIITRYNVPALALMLVRQSIILVNTAFASINDKNLLHNSSSEKLGVTL